MITGFNTDIEYDGVVYHVQTEDKGLDSPLILSLVYAGGAILASKRSPYEDLIAAGFDEELLAQRLKRQHRLICAAINAGRIDELKRMRPRPEDKSAVAPVVSAPPIEPVTAEVAPEILHDDTLAEAGPPPSATVTDDIQSLLVSNAEDSAPATPVRESPPEVESTPPALETPPLPPPEIVRPASAYTVHDSRRESPLGEKPIGDKGLAVSILDEANFRAGQTFNIRVLVENRTPAGSKPVSGAALSVKILGTTFRPQLYSVKTGRDGIAVFSAQIPLFTSGRAAILIRADADGKNIEIRRVIHAA